MKKTTKKILLTLIVLFGVINTVYGETTAKIHMYPTYYIYQDDKGVCNDPLKDNGNCRVNKTINGKTSELDRITVTTSSASEVTAYCVDVSAGLKSGDVSPLLSQNLAEYLNNTFNNMTKSKEITKKLNEYMYFGYGYSGHISKNYYIATQKLIWDELYNNGYRQEYYSPNVILTTVNGVTVDVSPEISEIKNLIANYYKTPSMCSSNSKLEIAKGETKTYTDTANVLSNYKVNCSNGLTCETSGNTLKITANQAGNDYKVTFTKDVQETYPVIYKKDNDQGVAVGTGTLGPVSCEFGIDSYANVQTSEAKIVVVISIGLIAATMAYAIYVAKKEIV